MMERVSDEWLNEAIPKYSAIDSKSKGGNVYLALCELRERRQMEDEQCELVVASAFMAIKTAEILQLLKKDEKEQRHTNHSTSGKDGTEATQEREKAILPLPVKRVNCVDVKTWTVKKWILRINERLDKLEDIFLKWSDLDSVKLDMDYLDEEDYKDIADKAADTITAITSMLEAMGIDERQRQEAQERVNQRNRERGRI